MAKWFGTMFLFCAVVVVSSCSEEISEDNFAIKTEQTITDYLADNPDKFSDLKKIFDRVKLGTGSDASTLTSVFSARGNYTVFAPNNSALAEYYQQLGVASLEELTEDQAQLIAYSCVIDNGDDAPYEEADFPTPGTFSKTNLYDRQLPCAQDTTSAEDSYYLINGTSRVIRTNIEVSNGMIHEVGGVIAPSADNLYELIAAAANMKVFAFLMRETSWSDSMAVADRDEVYENEYHDITYKSDAVSGTFNIPQRRYLGFTALVETDQVYADQWDVQVSLDEAGNVTNGDDILQKVAAKCAEIYPNSGDADNLKSPDNAVNRFVAYHIMNGKMAYDRFVHHCNEYSYSWGGDIKKPQTENMPTNVWDYYTTAGKYPGLIKITQVGDQGFEQDLDHHIYANRISIYNDAPDGDYTELGVQDAGLLLSADNGEFDNNAQNGYYFPVNKILAYNSATRKALGTERIRIDMTTMLPELISNSLRGQAYYHFPHGYFNNITNESSSTELLYLMDPSGAQWKDYQGDEVMVSGQYDFILKLPPVPQTATYEFRMGVSHNELRGMVQIYFGSDPMRLEPVGLPYDMRQQAGSVAVPWVADSEDQEINAENDKNMRNQGIMKAPNYFYATGTDQTARVHGGPSTPALRKIVITKELEQDRAYYLRFKNALKSRSSQFFMDYFEYVPANIYNGTEAEDIW